MTRTNDRSRSRRALWIVAGALIVTAACGGGDDGGDETSTTTAGGGDTSGASATTTPRSGDACDIVSDEVVADVLGVDIARREPFGEPGAPSVSCIKGTKRSNDLASNFYVSASVTANDAATVEAASAEAGSEPVAGLGDRAVYLPSDGALIIAVGPELVTVQVVKTGRPSSQQDAVTVANDVLGRRG